MSKSNMFILFSVVMISYIIGIMSGTKSSKDLKIEHLKELNTAQVKCTKTISTEQQDYRVMMGMCSDTLHDIVRMSCPQVYEELVQKPYHSYYGSTMQQGLNKTRADIQKVLNEMRLSPDEPLEVILKILNDKDK